MSGTSLADLRRHVAARPAWRCRVCAAPWPCQPAKLGLRIQYADNPVALMLYLCALLHDAIDDRLGTSPGDVDPADLFTRFVGWARRRPPDSAG